MEEGRSSSSSAKSFTQACGRIGALNKGSAALELHVRLHSQAASRTARQHRASAHRLSAQASRLRSVQWLAEAGAHIEPARTVQTRMHHGPLDFPTLATGAKSRWL